MFKSIDKHIKEYYQKVTFAQFLIPLRTLGKFAVVLTAEHAEVCREKNPEE